MIYLLYAAGGIYLAAGIAMFYVNYSFNRLVEYPPNLTEHLANLAFSALWPAFLFTVAVGHIGKSFSAARREKEQRDRLRDLQDKFYKEQGTR